MKRIAAGCLLAAALAVPAFADEAGRVANADSAAAGASHSAALSEGEVRRVDRDAKKITVRHGPLANLEMPAMTMVFRVDDPAILDSVKPGDKIRFRAEKLGGAYAITRIEPH